MMFYFLTRALTHRSYLNEHPDAVEDNERLEFLGDAVLDFLVGEWLYNRFPEMEEGELTQMRSAFVQTNQLAAFNKQFEYGKCDQTWQRRDKKRREFSEYTFM